MSRTGRILFFRGKGLISTLIRWQTRGEFSHVAVQFPSGEVFEAWQGEGPLLRGRGVRFKQFDDFSNCVAFEIQDSSSLQWELMQEWANDLVDAGAGYDYWSVIRFISRRRMPRANSDYFCSEVAMELTRKAQINLLSQRIPSDEVSPWLLSLSPRLLESTPLH